MKTLCFIPAKRESKRLPGKNLREIGGRSLLARTIDVAKDLARIGLLDLIVVSTDDAAIQRATVNENVPYHWRSQACRENPDATVRDVCVDFLLTRNDDRYRSCNRECYDTHGLAWDLMLILIPTSPLRAARSVVAAYRLMAEHGFEYPVMTAVRARKPPSQMFLQDVEGLWRTPYGGPSALNDWRVHEGGALWWKPEWLREDKTFYDRPCLIQEVPPEEAVNVDTELDLLIAEALWQRDVACGGEEWRTPR